MKNSSLILIYGLLLSGCGGLHIAPQAISARISTETFDFSNSTPADNDRTGDLKEKIMKVAGTSSPLYLHWTFVFAAADDAFTCENGIVKPSIDGLPDGIEAADSSFVLPFGRVDYHFGVEVIIGKENQYPFNSVTCYESGGNQTTVTVRGYYAGVVYMVPTAYQVQLRPLNIMGATTSNSFRQMKAIDPPNTD